jgi:PEP-CTERM motif
MLFTLEIQRYCVLTLRSIYSNGIPGSVPEPSSLLLGGIACSIGYGGSLLRLRRRTGR